MKYRVPCRERLYSSFIETAEDNARRGRRYGQMTAGIVVMLFCLLICMAVPAAAAPKFKAKIGRHTFLASERYQIKYENTAKITYKFYSSNEKIAKVTKKGIIKAKKAGTCNIIIKGIYKKGSKKQVWKKTVPITVYTCKLSSKSIKVKQGQKASLKIEGETLKRKIRWSSSDPAIAKVSSSGTVKGLTDGTAVITAYVGSYRQLTCSVTVTAKELSTRTVKLLVNQRTTYGAIDIVADMQSTLDTDSKVYLRMENPALGSFRSSIYDAKRAGTNRVHACCEGKVRVYVMNQVSWAAHRGYLDIRPENSTDAFEMAGIYGANFVETDIRITKDDVPVCFHDNELDRMTNGTGKVRKLTFEEVRSAMIDNGNGLAQCSDRRIPTLGEYLSICRKYGMIAMLELKNLGNDEEQQRKACHTIYSTLQLYGYLDRTIVCSKHADLLTMFRQETGAKIPIAALTGAWNGIKGLANVYSAYWRTPLGAATLSDWSLLIGKKGIARNSY